MAIYYYYIYIILHVFKSIPSSPISGANVVFWYSVVIVVSSVVVSDEITSFRQGPLRKMLPRHNNIMRQVIHNK